MKGIYDFDDIKSQIDICRYINDEYPSMRWGSPTRCQALWRGGDNSNTVAIDVSKNLFFDHKEGKGGSIIDLAMSIRPADCPTEFSAVHYLGDRYNIKPKHEVKKDVKLSRYDRLTTKEGYHEVAHYDYKNEDGSIEYTVVRLENKAGKKEILQRTQEGWGLGLNTKKLIYNLPLILQYQEMPIFICEGEKDCDTMTANDWLSTTNSGGSKSWNSDHDRYFIGRNVVILQDNDAPGEAHTHKLLSHLCPVANSIKVVIPSKIEKGDVTDYLTKEGGTMDSLWAMCQSTPCIDRQSHTDDEKSTERERAIEANRHPLENFIEEMVHRRNKEVVTAVPKDINALVREVHNRLLNFPRMIGSSMFDYDQDCKRVVIISGQDALFAWIMSKSKNNVTWKNKEGCVSKKELYEALKMPANAICYMAMSTVPHWPLRLDTFYTYTSLPTVTDASLPYLNKLANFFSPANDTYRTILKVLFCAPMFYSGTTPRPSWVIDSIDGPGVGKTTLVKMLALLYAEEPIDMEMSSLDKHYEDFIKRLLTTEARKRRICLCDNVTGTVVSSNLAKIITATTISGRPAYGKQEEIRANDITYIMTSNSSSLGNDMAIRCFFMKLAKSPRIAGWENKVSRYIVKNREMIYSEIIHAFNNVLSDIQPVTRFPDFESVVIRSMCKDKEEFNEVMSAIMGDSTSSNTDNEIADELSDLIVTFVSNLKNNNTTYATDMNNPTFITNPAMNKLINMSDSEEIKSKYNARKIKVMVLEGTIKGFDKHRSRLMVNGLCVYGLFMFSPADPEGKNIQVGQTVTLDVLSIGNRKHVLERVDYVSRKEYNA